LREIRRGIGRRGRKRQQEMGRNTDRTSRRGNSERLREREREIKGKLEEDCERIQEGIRVFIYQFKKHNSPILSCGLYIA